jgi:hypothetical protein
MGTESEFLHPVVGFTGGGGAGGFLGRVGVGSGAGVVLGKLTEEFFAVHHAGKVAAGVGGDFAVVADDGQLSAVGGAFDDLCDDGIRRYAGAGVGQREIGEFIFGGFVRLGAAVETRVALIPEGEALRYWQSFRTVIWESVPPFARGGMDEVVVSMT